jgi:DNA-binding NtrC family response regulator
LTEKKSHLKGKRILVVDDELDVLDTVEDILDISEIDKAQDFRTASEKISRARYDLAILDVMGVDGLKLLEKTVDKGIPTVIFTAHSMNVETFKASIEKGAISFLPKEIMADLPRFLDDLIAAIESGKEPWRILIDEMGSYFDERFGPQWKEENQEFWSNFARSIQTRFSTKG